MKKIAARSWVAGMICVWVLLAGWNGSAQPAAPAPAADSSLNRLAEKDWDYAKARHLLARAGFGGTPEEVAKLQTMGLRGAVDFLVNFQNQQDVDLPFHVETPDREQVAEFLKAGPEQKKTLTQKRRQEDMNQLRELREWWLKRMLQTDRPLEEKLVLFWHGHFATEHRTVKNSSAMYGQNQLFREHAAGNFGKLLHAIVHDAAMLRYLDNDRNVKGKPNENLAREIMELFSLGEGNYTENDIKEAARALTGYTSDRISGKFRFSQSAHDSATRPSSAKPEIGTATSSSI